MLWLRLQHHPPTVETACSPALGAHGRCSRVFAHTPPPSVPRLRSIFMRDGQEVHRLAGVPGQEGALEALVEQHLGVTL